MKGRSMSRGGRKSWWAAPAGLFILCAPRAAEACAVCYGAPDSAMTAGMNNAILLLLAVVAMVQVGFIGLFLSFWKRARRLRQRRARIHLTEEGAA